MLGCLANQLDHLEISINSRLDLERTQHDGNSRRHVPEASVRSRTTGIPTPVKQIRQGGISELCVNSNQKGRVCSKKAGTVRVSVWCAWPACLPTRTAMMDRRSAARERVELEELRSPPPPLPRRSTPVPAAAVCGMPAIVLAAAPASGDMRASVHVTTP
jgi:hypothetical protein